MFLYPFKLFVTLEHQIRNRLSNLETMHQERYHSVEEVTQFGGNKAQIRYLIKPQVLTLLLTDS